MLKVQEAFREKRVRLDLRALKEDRVLQECVVKLVLKDNKE